MGRSEKGLANGWRFGRPDDCHVRKPYGDVYGIESDCAIVVMSWRETPLVGALVLGDFGPILLHTEEVVGSNPTSPTSSHRRSRLARVGASCYVWERAARTVEVLFGFERNGYPSLSGRSISALPRRRAGRYADVRSKEGDVGFFQGLFGQGGTGSSGVPSELAERVEGKLAVVRHLVESRPFTRDGMTKYITLLERSGVVVPPEKQAQMLDAGSLVMPKPQADGTVVDGYEQLRLGFLGVHLEELTEVVRVLKQLPPSPGAVALLTRIIDETDHVQRAGTQ